MPRSRSLLALLAASAALVPATAAEAAPTRVCKSSDLRYPFEPGGPKTFGVFRLTITGGGCGTAHSVAERWMDRFEADLRDGDASFRLPRRVSGFRFRQLPPNAAQTYRLRGRKGSTSIRFDYVVPNG